MLWIAFALALPPSPDAPPDAPDLDALALWALQFGPRVARRDVAVLLEAEASERLFGGRRALLQRLSAECAEYGAAALAVAPTGRAAQALATHLVASGSAPGPARASCTARTLQVTLDALPLSALPELDAHGPTLARLGCASLGHVRRLPRGGLARRFPGLLPALDGAYGLVPEVFQWLVLPEVFDVRLELHARVETAPGLMFGLQRLMPQLRGWLSARQAGVAGVCLAWEHDLHRRGEAGLGKITVRTGQPTRDVAHLSRLLGEHLARTTLAAPAVAIRLRAVDVAPLELQSSSLLPEPAQDTGGGDFAELVERLSARLGTGAVLAGQVAADHRPELSQQWEPAAGRSPARSRGKPSLPGVLVDEPAWLLREPMPLAVVDQRPMYQGPLELLDGPQRVESGWWTTPQASDGSGPAVRDYYVALSGHCGLLWIFRERRRRQSSEGPGRWYLHGIYG